jgi:putative ABC transport system substrate-binding protein
MLFGGAVAWPLAARAQQHRGPVRLAFIPIGSPSNLYDRSLVEAFQRGLHRVGLIENQDVALDIVWAGDRPDQAVSEAVQRGAELLIPCGSSASVAAKRQTSAIPIVFLSVGDPVAVGLVMVARRGGCNHARERQESWASRGNHSSVRWTAASACAHSQTLDHDLDQSAPPPLEA